MANSLILNIPHSSIVIPEDDFSRSFLPFYCDDESNLTDYKKSKFIKEAKQNLEDELYFMTDWYTDELFDQGLGNAIIAKVSRLVCDTERFSHDDAEEMASRGMGFCYERGSKNQQIRKVAPEYKDEVLWRYYAPHHIALTDAVDRALCDNNEVFILDCHSFSNDPLPYEPYQESKRPDICIGTDAFHTSESLVLDAEKFFKNRGFSVAINYPYSGCIVPLKHYKKDKRVKTIMLEINRSLYLRSGNSRKNRHFASLLETIFVFEVMLKNRIGS